MLEYQQLFIGGEWVDPAGKATIDVISPHSEELVGRAPEGTTADHGASHVAAHASMSAGGLSR